MSTGAALGWSLVLLLGNAFFVGASFAVMSARRSQLEPIADSSRAARMALEALEKVSQLLVMAQLGITICSLGIGALAEDTLHHVFEHLFEHAGVSETLASPAALLGALLIVVYLHVVIGEMIPKNLAIAGPFRAALLLAPPLLLLSKVLKPLILVLEHVSKAIVRAFGVEPKDEVASTFTAEEVGFIVDESSREGLLDAGATDRIQGALEFSDRLARDVAVPLDRLVTLPEGATPEEIERLVAKHGYSRYVVRAADGDLRGYLHLKDILYARDEDFDIPVPAKRVRALGNARAEEEIEDVLRGMQRTGRHLARVVEADGSVIGVVFLEDVLEELVGAVTDESQRVIERAAERARRGDS